MCEVLLIGYGIWAKGGDAPGQETFELAGIDPLSSDNVLRVGDAKWHLTDIRTEVFEVEPPTLIEGFCMKGVYFKGELDIAEGTFDITTMQHDFNGKRKDSVLGGFSARNASFAR